MKKTESADEPAQKKVIGNIKAGLKNGKLKKPNATSGRTDLKKDLKEAMKEVKLFRERKLNLKTAEQLLNEL